MGITVRRVVLVVATYGTGEPLRKAYPPLEDEDIRQALEYAAANLEDRVEGLAMRRARMAAARRTAHDRCDERTGRAGSGCSSRCGEHRKHRQECLCHIVPGFWPQTR